ncbi:MAG: hypothetical protein KBE09_00705 [Candidatus Pacebacteria bacterium]|nr:hypothetical protein [Candidatus Paceibacterota bacterium]
MNDVFDKKVEETLTHLLQLLEVAHDGIEKKEIAGQLVYSVKTKETRRLIGLNGETLSALDMMAKKLLEKQGETMPHFVVDVDNYRTDHIVDIQQKATIMAERAKSFQYDVEMPPMSAYERLIVHATLQGVPQVKTESQGVGKERRLVIRYVP